MIKSTPIDSNLNKSVDNLCEWMPKVELHAHLNGSISESILEKLRTMSDTHLAKSNDNDIDNNLATASSLRLERKRTLSECWRAFKRIHDIVRTKELLYAATCEVIQEFCNDRVIYLELRTTPKKNHDIPNKEIYIETVIQAIRDCKVVKRLPITVKLLLSIDRRMDEKEGSDIVALTKKWMQLSPEIVVGLDISGDPIHGKHSWLISLMEKARSYGIPISCHLPEVNNAEEAQKFIEFHPERVAHGQFLHPKSGGTELLWNLAKTLQIPIEVCITSNLISGVAPSLEDHYIKYVCEDQIPFIICTDDCGVFDTTLSNEYKTLMRLAKLNLTQLKNLNVSSISYSFTTDDEKIQIKEEIDKWWRDYFQTL